MNKTGKVLVCIVVAIVAVLVVVLLLAGCESEPVSGDKVHFSKVFRGETVADSLYLVYVTVGQRNKWQRQIDSLERELSFMTRIADSRGKLIRCYADYINEHCDSFPVCGAGI